MSYLCPGVARIVSERKVLVRAVRVCRAERRAALPAARMSAAPTAPADPSPILTLVQAQEAIQTLGTKGVAIASAVAAGPPAQHRLWDEAPDVLVAKVSGSILRCAGGVAYAAAVDPFAVHTDPASGAVTNTLIGERQR